MTRQVAAVLVALVVGAEAPAAAQSVRIGDVVRVTPTARLHLDVRTTEGDDDTGLDLARRRIGMAGRVTSHVQFEVERELAGSGGWRDAFVNLRASRAVQVRAGHFKVPFSREQLTGAGSLDFIDRSRAVDRLAPGRSAGVAVHGRFAGRALGYELGAFTGDGTPARLPPPVSNEPTVAARITVRPLTTHLELGMAAATTDLATGRASFRGRLTTGDTFFAPVFASGRRLRIGGDLDWQPGPLGIRAEFVRTQDARRHQGIFDDTLPPLRARGGFVAATWAVAGWQAHRRANDGLAVTGISGLELTVRAESLSFGAGPDAGAQIWTPRAALVSTATERAWTAGVNWTANRFVRLQVNAVRETVVSRAIGAPRQTCWSPALRLQVAM